jgi:PAS domain S-box-containing protein
MGGPTLHPADEIIRLRRCINDLVSVSALPAVWSGGNPSQIASTLLDVLLSMLDLDLVYVQLKDPIRDTPVEVVRVAQRRKPAVRPHEIAELLRQRFGPEVQQWAPLVSNLFGDGDISIVPFRLGLQDEVGIIVAGSQRPDFPEQTESLLLTVAANQVAIGLHEARLLGEQKRLTNELDQRVALRTKELRAAVDELQLRLSMLQTIPVAAWTVAPDGKPDMVNQSWFDYTGQTPEYVSSDPEAWMSTLHPEDRERASKVYWDGIRSGRGFTMEARFLRAQDKTYRWHLNRAVALCGPEGKILRFVGTSTDIEDLKQSQEDLQRAEEKTRLIIDTALDAVIAMDSQGTITTWNKQAEIVFGWNYNEAVGEHMPDLIIPERHRMAHERGLRHFLNTGDGPILRRRIETTALRRSGDEFPVELEVVPMKVGDEWAFSAFIRDVTEAKLAEKKLRESELALRQLTETIPEMLWSATPDGAIDYCNVRLLEYTGFSASEIIGSGWTRLLHPDDADQTARVWVSCVATGKPYRVEVRTFHAADHAYRWCVTSALPLLDQQGRILKWHGTVVDMHDWRLAQEELRTTQAKLAHMTRVMALGALTASIAHEVNQPLSGIITNSSTCLRMLSADPPNVDGARETVRRTLRDANRASEVITGLRALFSRKDIATESVDLNEATREVVALSSNRLQRDHVIIRTEFDNGLPLVKGDRVQLQQVIQNFLQNALDAMSDVEDRPRQLLIRTERDKHDYVRLTVQDAGIGFGSQNPDRLFEAFYTTKNYGMGIGLSVSRSIIESHHGCIWARPNDGPGATFSFSVPQDPEGVTSVRGFDALRRLCRDGVVRNP